ncbi:hypothetical protein MP228_000952 [Amoeboaphelidium protococcarum]|nr:hypothetical protein MP228_004984 [Amoeboaphelidium protococcarum]KAI3654233.1 hypothetical protein MP228_000952 [Amoeboaphelidium protococcarum]
MGMVKKHKFKRAYIKKKIIDHRNGSVTQKIELKYPKRRTPPDTKALGVPQSNLLTMSQIVIYAITHLVEQARITSHQENGVMDISAAEAFEFSDEYPVDDTFADNMFQQDIMFEALDNLYDREKIRLNDPLRNAKADIMLRSHWRDAVKDIAAGIQKLAAVTQLDTCEICKTAASQTMYLCTQCTPKANLCNDCWSIVHQRQYSHVPQVLTNGVLSYVDPPPFKVYSGCGIAACLDGDFIQLRVLTFPAGVIRVQYQLCQCNDSHKLSQLVADGYIPCSPQNPRSAIDINLMKLFTKLFVNSRSSFSGFIHAMQQSCMLEVPDQFSKHLRSAFHIYIAAEMTLWNQLSSRDMICSLCPSELKLGTLESQLCEDGVLSGDQLQFLRTAYQLAKSSCQDLDTPHIPQISVDGNFKLVHVRNALSGECPPLGPSLFIDSKPSNDMRSNTKNEKSDCSNFAAVRQLSGRSSQKKHDVTGVFGAVCGRHGIPMLGSFSNIKKGESYQYADYAIEQIVDRTKASKMTIYYDIACQYDKKIIERVPKLQDIDLKFLVPSFHLYAHHTSCRESYSSKLSVATGIGAGEMTESLWSKIGVFGFLTKGVSLNLRNDALDYVLLCASEEFDSRSLILTLERYHSAQSQHSQLDILIQESSQYKELGFSCLDSEQFLMYERSMALRKKSNGISVETPSSFGLKKQYLEALRVLYETPNSKELLNEVTLIEKRLNIKARWVVGSLEYQQMKRLADYDNCCTLLIQLKDELVGLKLQKDFANRVLHSQKGNKFLISAIKRRQTAFMKCLNGYNQSVSRFMLDFGVSEKCKLRALRRDCSVEEVESMLPDDCGFDGKSQSFENLLQLRRRNIEEQDICLHEMRQYVLSSIVSIINLVNLISEQQQQNQNLNGYFLSRLKAGYKSFNRNFAIIESYLEQTVDKKPVEVDVRQIFQTKDPHHLEEYGDSESVTSQDSVDGFSDYDDASVVQMFNQLAVSSSDTNDSKNGSLQTSLPVQESHLISDVQRDHEHTNQECEIVDLAQVINRADLLRDFDSDHWMRGEALHVLMSHLSRQCSGQKVFYASQQFDIVSTNVIYRTGSERTRQNMLGKIGDDCSDIVVVNHARSFEGGQRNHWNIYHLKIDQSVCSMRYYCSLRYEFEYSIADKIQRFVSIRFPAKQFIDCAKVKIVKGPRQKDGSSCGVHSYWYAKQIANNCTITRESVDVSFYRQEIRQLLIQDQTIELDN